MARSLGRLTGALVLVLSVTSAASADTVRLTNGRSLEGRAVVLPNGDVELYSSMGMIKLPKAKVDRVETKETAEERVLRELEDLRSPTVDDLYEFAVIARSEGASTLSTQLFREALRLDPEHAASRRALGELPMETAAKSKSDRMTGMQRTALEAEQLKLLRALRAQANAAHVAELQRQLLLAAQLQETARRATPIVYGAPVATYGQVFLPAPQPRSNRTAAPPRHKRLPSHRAAATPPQTPRRPSTIVRSPRP